jgi:hypothetical protein
MIILRILLNGLIMGAEIAAVAAIAAAGFQYPIQFAAVTAALSFVLGLSLEAARLRNELPFYFRHAASLRFFFVPVVALVEAFLKGVLAGLAALFTFSGTDTGRLYWVAIVFGLTVYAGSSLLRVLSLRLDAYPARWGYFRLAPPLGLLFSAGLAALAAYGLFASPSVADIGWKIVWELPQKPSVSQVSELFFQLKQAFDDFIVTLLSGFLDQSWARLVGIAVSVNVLAGFVASVYAAIIASAVRRAEDRLL